MCKWYCTTAVSEENANEREDAGFNALSPLQFIFPAPCHWLHDYKNGGAILALLWRLMECMSLKKMLPLVCQTIIREAEAAFWESERQTK